MLKEGIMWWSQGDLGDLVVCDKLMSHNTPYYACYKT